MSATEYRPAPLDTSNVLLPQELEELEEVLARNAHDIWAQRRFADGWRWGTRQDDSQKLHPSLVPYGELPESEKAYDRSTAMETVKAIMALGFQVTKH